MQGIKSKKSCLENLEIEKTKKVSVTRVQKVDLIQGV